MKGQREKLGELADILSIISITVVALLIILLFKAKAGILGMVLGTIAVATLIYWLKEIKRIFKKEEGYSPGEAEWFYDLIKEGEGLTLIAKVPGPAKEVNVRLVDDVLEIRGGRNFTRRVHVPKDLRLQSKSYTNGVLHVKLQSMNAPQQDTR